jgi:hypothetical protein
MLVSLAGRLSPKRLRSLWNMKLILAVIGVCGCLLAALGMRTAAADTSSSAAAVPIPPDSVGIYSRHGLRATLHCCIMASVAPSGVVVYCATAQPWKCASSWTVASVPREDVEQLFDAAKKSEANANYACFVPSGYVGSHDTLGVVWKGNVWSISCPTSYQPFEIVKKIADEIRRQM